MKIELIRFAYFEDRTLGLFGKWYCIEREWRNNEINVSCIPEGEYKMMRVDSPRFGDDMWEVADVPNRSHILIHVANYASNVIGCLGLGTGLFSDLGGVSRSGIAIDDFYKETEDETEMDLVIRSGAI